jgi:hypothetical protein
MSSSEAKSTCEGERHLDRHVGNGVLSYIPKQLVITSFNRETMGNYDEPVRDRGISFVLRYLSRWIGWREHWNRKPPIFHGLQTNRDGCGLKKFNKLQILIQAHMLRSIDLAAYRTTFCGVNRFTSKNNHMNHNESYCSARATGRKAGKKRHDIRNWMISSEKQQDSKTLWVGRYFLIFHLRILSFPRCAIAERWKCQKHNLIWKTISCHLIQF